MSVEKNVRSATNKALQKARNLEKLVVMQNRKSTKRTKHNDRVVREAQDALQQGNN